MSSESDEYADATEAWLNERRAEKDYAEYEFRGQVNRTEISKELGYSRSVTGSNPRIKQLLKAADIEFYGEKIGNSNTAAHQSAAERAEKRTGQYSARNNSLEQRVAELESEVAELRKQNRAYRERDKLIENGAGGFRL